MTRETSPDPSAAREAAALFEDWGQTLGLKFYRLCLGPRGKGEVEFAAPNPVEVLVYKWNDLEELRELLTNRPREGAVFRKKCLKCLMHERPAA
ncbi:MAG: hypothetical protein V1816_19910 [Pseudomonadota bacterium]